MREYTSSPFALATWAEVGALRAALAKETESNLALVMAWSSGKVSLGTERAEHEITRKVLAEIIDAADAESRADLDNMKCSPGAEDHARHTAACMRYARALHAAGARLKELEARK